MSGHIQLPSEVIDISSWHPDDRFPVYPEGSREKSAWISPQTPELPFLLGSHRYLFKHSSDRHPVQFWGEIVAYRLGCLMGIPVPPAYVAQKSTDPRPAALIEWFYRSDDQTVNYEPGTVHMKRIIHDFDVKKGRQHNILTVLETLSEIDADLISDMARILVFDVLIGNTDRHQENWGILWRGIPSKPQLAPAFDNGTSLGHEVLDDKIPGYITDPQQTVHYIARGRHHMRWHQNRDEKIGHFELIEWLIKNYPNLKQELRECVSFDLGLFNSWLCTLPTFPVPVVPTMERIQWIECLLCLRIERLRSVLAKKD
ncbi:MAG: HipA domain-containing protein [Magnetococcales bacterium]|nr:HipA domain-containing protein [Magnetococcales bacterium]MBF0116581.1 HipA domain-containing protein [Magnetococcales bacterium]